MTAPDLKPCPFCGGIAYLRDDASHSTAYFIGCATEDCFGEIHWGQNEAEAVTAWNTRAPLAERLEAALHNCVGMLDQLVAESGRDIEWGAEDPFRMGEWFEPEDLAQIEQARAALKGDDHE